LHVEGSSEEVRVSTQKEDGKDVHGNKRERGEEKLALTSSWPAPTKGFGMMHNFPPADAGATQPPPAFFVRAAGSISRHGADIVLPRALETVLYEGELVVVIGKRAQRVSPEEAVGCILGYTCGMDGSPLVLDATGQRDAARSLAGKSADGVAPVGPLLLSQLDSKGHAITLRVNGKVMEEARANTKDFIWDPPRIVSEISRTVALEPGDVIFCGARKAIEKLTPGDVVEVEVEGIGVLRNRVVAE
jgi:2-keto-4-pentenoate hydratase/2-oxohepta-3-ene-1,7-dioic acid hydratase in catechol pathway